MTEREVLDLLKSKLSIRISDKGSHEGCVRLRVSLLLDDEEIDYDCVEIEVQQ